MEKVDVIIPTYNRFKYLLNTIKSVKAQTYPNIDIIVVNDGSTQAEYYSHDWVAEGVTIIHLPQNTKQIFGFACAAYVRNKGVEAVSGTYVGFCDDDDVWLPNKVALQIAAMEKTGCEMSCTDGFGGHGPYDLTKTYPRYNAECHFNTLKQIYKNRGSRLMDNGFPDIWTLEFLKIHNCVVCSSVLMKRTLFDKINGFRNVRPPGEDYDCWLRALNHTNSVYINDPCFYYDGGHGDGQNW